MALVPMENQMVQITNKKRTPWDSGIKTFLFQASVLELNT